MKRSYPLPKLERGVTEKPKRVRKTTKKMEE